MIALVLVLITLVAPPSLSAGPGVSAEPTSDAERTGAPEELMAPATTLEDVEATPDLTPPLAPLVRRLLDDELTTADQRAQLRLFHGQWDALERPGEHAAALAAMRYELDSPALADADPLTRSESAWRRGEPEQTLALLEGDGGAAAGLLKARALQDLGRPGDAADLLRTLRDKLIDQQVSDPAELTALAEGLILLAKLEGRPAQDYHVAMGLLSRARTELDPLYWPARLAEARLLWEKDNAGEAEDALLETLALNPRSSEAWRLLGEMAISSFNFEIGQQAVDKLRAINPEHLYAGLLEVRMRLQQKDAAAARAALSPLLERYPRQRQVAAAKAAVEGMAYDEQAMRQAFANYAALAPGGAEAHLFAGEILALGRQYELAEDVLREAVERAPNDAFGRVELGLLLMQAGKLPEARQELAEATRLDPFNRRAANSLQLVIDLLDYETIETDHFVIRYPPGIDAVLAKDMPGPLERIYDEVTAVFGYEPTVKTQIDLLPDEKSFGVRITGIPDIWTIAASTGPTIALTPPREGRNQRGTFDWVNVIRHEFVHTVTLEQTTNRLPHWFTEAAAVSMEMTGMLQDTAQTLAWAMREGKLFNYQDINWGFIRPKQPYERPLAYAQAAWMLEYITYRFGHQAVLDMLARYMAGETEASVLRSVTGMEPDAFMEQFKAWGRTQVARWGLDDPAPSEALAAALADPDTLLTVADATKLYTTDPEHPDVHRLVAMVAMQAGDFDAAEQALRRYAKDRPLDPWSHRQMVQLALAKQDLASAEPSLRMLDQVEGKVGNWAHLLAQMHRARGDHAAALAAVERALHREPYNPEYRQFAATVALQAGDMDAAIRHLEAMPLLEPDRAIHHVRLAAIYARQGRDADARTAAEAATKLDPNAPVERYLAE